VLNFTSKPPYPRERTTIQENCSLLCYYAASSNNFLPTFRETYLVPFKKVVPKRR